MILALNYRGLLYHPHPPVFQGLLPSIRESIEGTMEIKINTVQREQCLFLFLWFPRDTTLFKLILPFFIDVRIQFSL